MSQYPGPDMSQPDDDSTKRYGSSESETKPSGSGSQPRKRASRAGTRSVSNLSAAQLERKRANDREAQRAIRQRTKDHIESLERKVAEYTGIQEQRERVLAANQARVRELEQENAYLRSRMGNDAFMMQIPSSTSFVKSEGTDRSGKTTKPTDSALGHSTQTSPQTRFSAEQISRPASQTARHSVSGPSSNAPSRSEAWRQQPQQGAVFSPTEPTVSNPSRPEPSRSVSWRNPSEVSASSTHSLVQNPMDQSARSYSTPNAHEQRPGWNSGAASYPYMLDPQQQQPPSYSAGSKPVFPHQNVQNVQNVQGGGYMPPSVPSAQSHAQSYGQPLATPSAEFQNLSMQSPANPAPQGHEQAGDHAGYGVQSAYQGAQRPMAGGYPQPGAGQGHMMEYQGGGSGQGYSYGGYHGGG
ncbi:hypothetical protein CAC42_7014 [Sphaceloma murrayae]|uniref:BZIP domain-containing protein n=1 Tax=Sphaceloma murrayae TaxID=2082308 RepID=A0A2K1QQM6_9PEZI|nr:hypothetical protein CAC42_7014 [Sphaceloma murrayae]